MADPESSPSGQVIPIGIWDVLLLVAFTGFVCYYFLLRKKKEEDGDLPDFSFKVRQRLSSVDDGETGSFIDRMKRKDYKVAIFFGSQTGTGEDYGGRILKDLRRMRIGCTLLDPEEHEMSELSRLQEIENSLVLFIVATYGEGDPTDNARTLFDWLGETDAETANLTGTRFAVFGLGNKTYEHYNFMGRLVDKKLEEFGSERFFRLGEGDDDRNIEQDFLMWREQFLEHVREQYDITAETLGQIREFEIDVHDPPPSAVFTGEPFKINSYKTQKPIFKAKNPFLSQIRDHKELHSAGDRSCMHVELDITDTRLKYSPGDHVAILPVNNSDMVEEIGQRLAINMDTVMSLIATEDSPSHKTNPFPCPCSYRTAFQHYVDIASFPRTNLLESLVEYCSDDGDKQRLREVTAPGEAGRNAYNDFICVDGRNLLDVLNALPSLKPPVDLILELLPRLQVRYYSISSSLKMHPDRIHVTASTHDYITQTGRRGSGVCTSWLESLRGNDGARVPIYIRKSTLRMPMKPIIPIIMVGPGTGLAPFRGFVQERHHMKESGKGVGETRLYFGCRRKSEDFLYREELESYEASGALVLRAAFSREPDQPKVYVTHLLREDGAQIWSLLSQENAHFYVCGDAKHMAKDVHSVLLELTREHGGKTVEQAEAFIKQMKTLGRYVVDAWS